MQFDKTLTSIFIFLLATKTIPLLAPVPKSEFPWAKSDPKMQAIYKKSLVAIRNIVDVRSELKEKIETIEEKKVELEKKKEDLRAATREIERIFPRTRVDVDASAQSIIKRLRGFSSTNELEKHWEEGGPKSNKAIALGIISGVLLSSVLGLVIWKGAHARSKQYRRTKDGIFIDTITRYLESNR